MLKLIKYPSRLEDSEDKTTSSLRFDGFPNRQAKLDSFESPDKI